MRYRVFDHGRKVGSIGVTSLQIADVDAETPELAAAEWYRRFELGSGCPMVVESGTFKGVRVQPDFSRQLPRTASTMAFGPNGGSDEP